MNPKYLCSASTGAPVAIELSGGLGNGRFGLLELASSSLSVNSCTRLQDRSSGKSFARPVSLFCKCGLFVSWVEAVVGLEDAKTQDNNFRCVDQKSTHRCACRGDLRSKQYWKTQPMDLSSKTSCKEAMERRAGMCVDGDSGAIPIVANGIKADVSKGKADGSGCCKSQRRAFWGCISCSIRNTKMLALISRVRRQDGKGRAQGFHVLIGGT